MASCLGLYIENNLIKYAKVSKEKDKTVIQAFGVKVYDKLEDTIRQIVEETYSYKIPVCINLSQETYQYFNMFAMLSKKDLDKAIKTEFDIYCNEKGYNPNVFETRYAVVENITDSNKLKVIFVTSNKIELNKQIQLLEKYKLSGIYPLPMAITNLIGTKPNEDFIVINIEEKATITTVINKNIYDVKVLEQGSGDFLDKINLKENSYLKAYEACKETTIYTSEGKTLTEEQTGYLEEIMPVLYQIVGQAQKTINESVEKIEKVYITGTGALINNVDLYFEEYLEGVSCEILKPNFVTKTQEINIKDYIEVNSATAIALMGMGVGIAGMNFKKNTVNDKLKEMFTIELNGKKDKVKKGNSALDNLFINDLKEPLDKTEKGLLNLAIGVLILFVVYAGFSTILKNEYIRKGKQADESISNTRQQISAVETDDNAIKEITNDYTAKISNLEEINRNIEERNRIRGAIPGLLNQLMNVIPSSVQITSIENTNTNHVEIIVQSPKYEQIAFLIGSIKTDVILTNVISTSGQKTGDVVLVKIEGDLP